MWPVTPATVHRSERVKLPGPNRHTLANSRRVYYDLLNGDE